MKSCVTIFFTDSTIEYRKRNDDEWSKASSKYTVIEAEDFRMNTRGQQSQQPASYPPPTSHNAATSQHSTSHTYTIAQRRSILDIILPKTNRNNYPDIIPTVINHRKLKDYYSTSAKARLMPKVFSVKRIQSLNHRSPGKLEQFELRDGTTGEFTSRGILAAEERRIAGAGAGGGNSLLSEILLKTSDTRKQRTTSNRKRRSIEEVTSGSELPSGAGEGRGSAKRPGKHLQHRNPHCPDTI